MDTRTILIYTSNINKTSLRRTTMEKKTYEPIPKGEYSVTLKNFEDKKTKKGGRMIAAAFQVVGEGEHEGRLVFGNYNYENQNSEVAEKIAREQLGKFIAAASNGEDDFETLGGNLGRLADYQGATVIARVGVEEPQSYIDGNGAPQMSKARNKITSFAAL